MEEGKHAQCGLCNKGLLIPVNLGKGPDRSLKYRCNNPECNARFDEHGYETYNEEKQDWERPTKG